MYNHTFWIFANAVDTEWSHGVALIYISIMSETEYLFNCLRAISIYLFISVNCLILIFIHFPIRLGILKFLFSLCAIGCFAQSEHDLLVLQLPSDGSLLPAALPARPDPCYSQSGGSQCSF